MESPVSTGETCYMNKTKPTNQAKQIAFFLQKTNADKIYLYPWKVKTKESVYTEPSKHNLHF